MSLRASSGERIRAHSRSPPPSHVEMLEMDNFVQDDVHPLLASENLARRKAFELEMEDRYDESKSTFLEDAWKVIASVLLTACLLGTFVVSYKRNTHQLSGGANNNLPACAKALDINFTHLYEEMYFNKTSFCQQQDTCKCTNPVLPRNNTKGIPGWEETRIRNVGLAESVSDIDVLFLGDSITEQWYGTFMGHNGPVNVALAFQELFNGIGKHTALPLGISADRSNELLYRIQNGEVPDTIHPKVIWVLIGTNDKSDSCSRESILAANFAIVKELAARKPTSKIVINSLLPRGRFPLLHSNDLWMDFQWINERLECLAFTNENFYFFNGTSYFLTADGEQVNVTLMPDFLHPNKDGALIWGHGIVEKLHQILD